MRKIRQLTTSCTSESQAKGSYNPLFHSLLHLVLGKTVNKEDGGAIQKQLITTYASLS